MKGDTITEEVAYSLPKWRESLDAKQREGQARLEAALLAARGRRKRVLVVDDEPDIRDSITGLVEACGGEATGVSSGEAALDYLRLALVDLVLLDLKMPGMSGVDTFREILKLRPAQVVILVTGYIDSPMITEALQLRVISVMIKPITKADMEKLLVRGIL